VSVCIYTCKHSHASHMQQMLKQVVILSRNAKHALTLTLARTRTRMRTLKLTLFHTHIHHPLTLKLTTAVSLSHTHATHTHEHAHTRTLTHILPYTHLKTPEDAFNYTQDSFRCLKTPDDAFRRLAAGQQGTLILESQSYSHSL